MGCMDSWFSGKESKRKRERVQSSGIGYALHEGKRCCHSAAKGGRFHPPQMPVPPSGPSKQHNSVPRLRFIPAKVVYGSKRLVPSGANPLHH
ncbi:hypothetical protein IEQ34_023825 [Dendrobium chrysotoxum]|uniref:Uncharacterized protein n=1 Tax=Dendrobium chrysotoxum TaxID=161865 RepID=A0AAV7FJM6_DENCH|nr:hypothetical protein IEQ34_023825 [Dendrobium chrysotoxum]